jgi:hypothetical protein
VTPKSSFSRRAATLRTRSRCGWRAAAWCTFIVCTAVAPERTLAADPPADEAPASREALFGDDVTNNADEATVLKGFVALELAYTTPAPAHWSRILTRAQLDATGAFSTNVKWKLSGRVDYDAVYSLTDFYSPAVAHDARFDFFARENFLDVNAGDWNFRLGRQQIVWGEMVALFAADVVSAKDLREFILPDFSVIRIPQWAARAEYFKDDFHAELVWIPVASYDKIGVPGSQFYPFLLPPPPGFATAVQDEQFPDRSLAHTNYGVRLSRLSAGWDVAGYYYGSMDQSPTFYRTIVGGPQPTFLYQPRHDRINQGGFTLAKDFGSLLFKTETVYTSGRKVNVADLSVADGVIAQRTLDVVAGIEFPLPVLTDTRINLQGISRVYVNHDSRLSVDKYENGYSIYATTALGRGWEGTLLWASSLNRNDSMLRVGLARTFEHNWRFAAGVDVFSGSPQGLFGQYDNSDRVYTQVTYSF